MPIMEVGTNINPTGQLDDFNIFREGHFYFIYYCSDCIRNFESSKEVKKCKFCENKNIKQVVSKKGVKKTTYRLFCPVCESIIETNEEKIRCDKCANPLTEMYRFNELDILDQARIRILKLRKSAAKTFFSTLPEKPQDVG
jgi:RecJ-like exonuclease